MTKLLREAVDQYLQTHSEHQGKMPKRVVTLFTPFFGSLLLKQITRAKVEEYKNLRREQHCQYGTPPKESTVNRELATLRHMLTLARDEGLIETVPVIKLYDEKKFVRRRFITEEEHRALLAAVARPVQRVLVCLYETAMRPSEPSAL